jgi:hypothetical protein
MPNLHHLRLGNVRRNIRNYSQHDRRFGKTDKERMLEKKYSKLANDFAFMIVDTMERQLNQVNITAEEQEELEMLILAYATNKEQVKEIQTPYLEAPDPIEHLLIGVDSFTAQNLFAKTGYTKLDIKNLQVAMRVPHYFILNSGL